MSLKKRRTAVCQRFDAEKLHAMVAQEVTGTFSQDASESTAAR